MWLLQPSYETESRYQHIDFYYLESERVRNLSKSQWENGKNSDLNPGLLITAAGLCRPHLSVSSDFADCEKELQLRLESGFSIVKIVIDWALTSARRYICITSFNSQNNSVTLLLLPPFHRRGNWGAKCWWPKEQSSDSKPIFFICALCCLSQSSSVGISVASRRLSLRAV